MEYPCRHKYDTAAALNTSCGKFDNWYMPHLFYASSSLKKKWEQIWGSWVELLYHRWGALVVDVVVGSSKLDVGKTVAAVCDHCCIDVVACCYYYCYY